ncbi:hypothetical protein AF335_18595 [Streptomyces eurocidicus]|uniref:Chromosome segregation ATPase n=1 Tax=Streptomyces eurocidicus TaxID=66423 RepID=A0A2N8NUZ6_STREU|nr:hypothetical protein [Streptomyces eurocidicus]MBB5122590.1 chromosome segregation ATPase [Streptomyces eurocidicus]PNE32559.1 hypothetical protein AF335_18595 [Streptomyces eurocidicus]
MSKQTTSRKVRTGARAARAAVALGAGAFITVLVAGVAQAASEPVIRPASERTAPAKLSTDRKALIEQTEKHLGKAKSELARIQKGIRNGTYDAKQYALALEMYGKDVIGLSLKYDELREGKPWGTSELGRTQERLAKAESELARIQKGIRNGTYDANRYALALEMHEKDVIGLTYKIDDIATGGLKR